MATFAQKYRPDGGGRMRDVVAGTAAVFLGIVAVLSLWFGGLAAWSDASSLQARWTVSQWRQGKSPPYTPALWAQTRSALEDALQTTPDNAHLLDDLGFLAIGKALGMGAPAAGSAEQAQQQALIAQAVAHYRQGAVLRPTFPYTWANLAFAKHLRAEHDTEFWAAYDNAMRYGRHEAGVHPALMQIAFGQWANLGAERQQWVMSLLTTAAPMQRKQWLEMAKRYGLNLME